MNITERDIFHYVCCQYELSSWKEKQLNVYKNYLREQFLICSSAQAIINTFAQQSLINEDSYIAAKLRYEREIDWESIDFAEQAELNIIRLAADSPEEASDISVDTFKDDKNKLIYKIITSQKDRKLYVFKSDNSRVENISIKLHPAEKVINIAANDKASIIDKDIKISGVELIG